MITITEGLAEIKTIFKRIEKKREFILANVARQEMIKDPLAKDGGSEAAIAREVQSVGDLLERVIKIRAEINKANQANAISIGGETRTIADWLTWKREISTPARTLWDSINSQVANVKQQAQQRGVKMVSATAAVERPEDVVLHVNVQDVAKRRESIEEVLGILDGQLSLKNATITIDV